MVRLASDHAGGNGAVFRRLPKNGEDATLTVSLAKTNGPTPPAPPPTTDPFSAGSCVGPALTAAKTLAMLDVSRGVLGATSPATSPRKRNVHDRHERDSLGPSHPGDVIVSFKNNAPRVRVRADAFDSSWGDSTTI